MGAGDLDAFRAAGRTLRSLGLIQGTEGNLSTSDGKGIRITRTGARLDRLEGDDLLQGTIEQPPAGASSDLAHHLGVHREHGGPSAVVHAHPPGTVPASLAEGQPHGVYASGHTLELALAAIVDLHGSGTAARGMTADGWIRLAGPVEWNDRDGEDDRVVGPAVTMIDQTRLPADLTRVVCRTAEDVADAIRRMVVRGAPVLGIAAALGLALAARSSRAERHEELLEELEKTGALLAGTRPTAVNIRWAVERVRVRARATADTDRMREAVLEEALGMQAEDAVACSAMGWLGQELIPEGARILTHCNTGMLCTAGIGTAQAVIHCAHLAGKGIHVWVDETRPLLQGARLTAWELRRLGIPMTLVADSAAGSLMSRGLVDLVITGADRIAANGDVANKVGTYQLAVLARHHRVPFYVVAPTSTVDLATPDGRAIPIEERDPQEVLAPRGVALAPEGTIAANPSFDVTPAELVTAIVTEKGIVRTPFPPALAEVAEVTRG